MLAFTILAKRGRVKRNNSSEAALLQGGDVGSFWGLSRSLLGFAKAKRVVADCACRIRTQGLWDSLLLPSSRA